MALLGTAFQIGRSALAAYQAGVTISGQNIANAGNADYTRLNGRLRAEVGGPVLGGVRPGAGVRLAALQRNIDEAVEGRLRSSLATRKGAETRYSAMNQIESLFNELSDADLSSRLGTLFANFASLQTSPEDMSARNIVLSGARGAVDEFTRLRRGLLDQVANLNDSVELNTRRTSDIAGEIAQLNQQIVNDESGSGQINSPLRDRRDGLLRELAEFVDISVRHQDTGSVNVYVGSEPLVEFDRSRGLVAETHLEDGLEIVDVRFADDNTRVNVSDGLLAGVLSTRDTIKDEQLARLDQLANGMIYEVNRIHATGHGLIGQTATTGVNAVRDPGLALNATGNLNFPVQNGTFIVNVRDRASGTVITRQIEVDLDGIGGDDTTLADLAGALDTVPGLSATVTPDNRLSVAASPGQEFWFSEDSSGALAALGMNAFFQGADAGTIALAPDIAADPRLIAAARGPESADGDNAGLIAGIGEWASELLGGLSVNDFHSETVGRLAVAAGAALTTHEAADTVYQSLVAQRESVSGVSLDEEAINLMKFEKAFQGATRYIGVLDQLANEMLSIVR